MALCHKRKNMAYNQMGGNRGMHKVLLQSYIDKLLSLEFISQVYNLLFPLVKFKVRTGCRVRFLEDV